MELALVIGVPAAVTTIAAFDMRHTGIVNPTTFKWLMIALQRGGV